MIKRKFAPISFLTVLNKCGAFSPIITVFYLAGTGCPCRPNNHGSVKSMNKLVKRVLTVLYRA
jgi:hypothetical protein